MNTCTLLIPAQKNQELKSYLIKNGYHFSELAHGYFKAKAPHGSVNVLLFKSQKCLLQGKNVSELAISLSKFLGLKLDNSPPSAAKANKKIDIPPYLVGVDESGKGDVFGPLVSAAVYVGPHELERIRKLQLNIVDSKQLKTSDIFALAADIKHICKIHQVLPLMPKEYNKRYAELQNLNVLLTELHVNCFAPLLSKVPADTPVLVDQFDHTGKLERHLKHKGLNIELIEIPKAESYLACAAASILARERFLSEIEYLSKTSGVLLKPGAGAVVDSILSSIHRASLSDIAKMHFKNVTRLSNDLN